MMPRIREKDTRVARKPDGVKPTVPGKHEYVSKCLITKRDCDDYERGRCRKQGYCRSQSTPGSQDEGYGTTLVWWNRMEEA